jgi:hypothetical protein
MSDRRPIPKRASYNFIDDLVSAGLEHLSRFPAACLSGRRLKDEGSDQLRNTVRGCVKGNSNEKQGKALCEHPGPHP